MSLLYFRHTDTHAHTHAQTHKVDTDTQSPAPSARIETKQQMPQAKKNPQELLAAAFKD